MNNTTYAEDNKWVIVEVSEASDGTFEYFFAPETLHIEYGWVGSVIWYVYTNGFELSPTEGIVFTGTGFNGKPQPDPSRPGCWIAATMNQAEGQFPYEVAVQRTNQPRTILHRADPVVENDPPPPTPKPLHALSLQHAS